MSENKRQLSADQLAYVLNMDKMIIQSISTTCFRRCVGPNYDNENLN